MVAETALTNVDAVLLWILLEQGPTSGFKIDRVLEVRGYRDWAHIGKTSVYLGLKRLEEKGLIRSKRDTKKTGCGPKPQLYRVSPEGGRVARAAMLYTSISSVQSIMKSA